MHGIEYLSFVFILKMHKQGIFYYLFAYVSFLALSWFDPCAFAQGGKCEGRSHQRVCQRSGRESMACAC